MLCIVLISLADPWSENDLLSSTKQTFLNNDISISFFFCCCKTFQIPKDAQPAVKSQMLSYSTGQAAKHSSVGCLRTWCCMAMPFFLLSRLADCYFGFTLGRSCHHPHCIPSGSDFHLRGISKALLQTCCRHAFCSR